MRFWQKGCLGSRGEEQARRNRFTFYQDFVSYVFNSTPNTCLHKHTVECWIVQITYSSVLLIYDTTSDKEKNLKCSARFKQEESLWWQARECVTCFSTTPWCTHTTLSLGNSCETLCTGSEQLSARESSLQLPLPELGVQITKSRTSLKHLSYKLL